MSSETYWAVRRREIASRKPAEAPKRKSSKKSKSKAAAPAPEPVEEVSDGETEQEDAAGEVQGEESAPVQEQGEEGEVTPAAEAETLAEEEIA